MRPSRFLLGVGIGAWILVVLLITLFPAVWEDSLDTRILHPIPFQEVFEELQEHDGVFSITIVEMIGNLILLLPLGLLLAFQWPAWWNAKRVVTLAAVFSTAIEGIQFSVRLGRTASATDVLLNTAGAGLGYIIVRLVRRRRRASRR